MRKVKSEGETAAILLGLLVASWILTLLVFASELIPSVASGLKATFTHHWIGKIVITYTIFFIVWLGATASIKSKTIENVKAWKWITVVSLILEIILIAALFVWLFFAE